MTSPNATVPFRKGHGTGNDFVLLFDPENHLSVTADVVAGICDRRRGIGADGILRAVRVERADRDPHLEPDGALWFMDYRNADGSLAEMCGNGMRVFVRDLCDRGVIDAGQHRVLTRGGVVVVDVPPVGDVTVHLGVIRSVGTVQVAVGDQRWAAVGLTIPNPHAVVHVDDLAQAGALREAPDVVPADVFPDGVNVEFVVPIAADHMAMRVYERGVGETLSCGTGACAAAYAHAMATGRDRQPWQMRVDVPGGRLLVDHDGHGALALTGPAEFVADGVLTTSLWSARVPR